MNNEIWKDIPNFPGYQASTEGKIRSKDRWIWASKGGCRTGHAQPFKGMVLKPTVNNAGYETVNLQRKRKGHIKLVHRVILETFVGPCPEGMETRHLDGTQANNNILNLTWGTRAENIADRYRTNGGKFFPTPTGGKKLTPCKVRNARKKYEQGVSIYVLAEQYNVSYPAMCHVVKRVSWERDPKSGIKLSPTKVRNIRKKYEAGVTVTELSEQYDLSTAAMYKVVNRLTWDHVL